jgi:hypothetical protein
MQLRHSSIVMLTLLVAFTAAASRSVRAQLPGDATAPAPQVREDSYELDGTMRLTVRPSMLADNIEYLAGREVTILNARVVGVFEPHAFLIESATREPESVGQRDRILVLLDRAALRIPDEVLVASTVKVFGVARSLLGMQVSAEVPWPTRLDRERVERLDVRASVLATSVQTPEGIELTQRTGKAAPARSR